MSATLTIEFDPGYDIENAFKEAVVLAGRLGLCVKFKFNQTTCIAYPYGDPLKGVNHYHATLDTKYPFAVAN